MFRGFVLVVCIFFICAISQVGCRLEQRPLRPDDQSAVYVWDDGDFEEIVPIEFVILDEEGRPVDERNDRMLRQRPKEVPVAEQEILSGEALAATNELRMKFKKSTANLKPVAGRPVVRRKPKPKMTPTVSTSAPAATPVPASGVSAK